MWGEPVTTVAPATTPVSVTDIKTFLRIDHDDDDQLLGTLIAAATARAEATTGTRFIEQTVSMWATRWSAFRYLPIGPVRSITSVRYEDIDGVNQVFEDFELFGSGLTQGIRLTPGASWPNGVRPVVGAINVVAVVGYEALPQSIVAAIMLMVGDLYANRETVVTGTVAVAVPMSMQVEALLNQNRIWL